MIAVQNNGEINTKIMNHSRTQTYHLMPSYMQFILFVVYFTTLF
jgi:hypothetical protein